MLKPLPAKLWLREIPGHCRTAQGARSRWPNNFTKFMRLYPSLLVAAVCVCLGTTTAVAKGVKKEGKSKATRNEPKEQADKQNVDKGSKREKDPKKVPEPDGKMSLPIVAGHPSKGLQIPYFGGDGKLQMTFAIGLADRLDENHVRMDDMQVETFDSLGKSEMLIDLPSSVMDLKTRILSTDKTVVIKRSDFEITGQTMEFNTETKQGKLEGNVRMIIYNMDNEVPKETKAGE